MDGELRATTASPTTTWMYRRPEIAAQSPRRGSMIQRTGTRKVYSRSPSAYGRVHARRSVGLQMGKHVAPSMGERTLGSQLVVSPTHSSGTPAVGVGSEAVTVITSSADAETAPELSVTVNGIVTSPLKLAAGTNTSVAASAAVSGVVVETGVVPSA